jgi:hypothetical protein
MRVTQDALPPSGALPEKPASATAEEEATAALGAFVPEEQPVSYGESSFELIRKSIERMAQLDLEVAQKTLIDRALRMSDQERKENLGEQLLHVRKQVGFRG